MSNLLDGQLVRLVAANAEKDAEAMARWTRDAEYGRLLDTDPAMPRSPARAKEDIQKWMENDDPTSYGFMIRTLADDKLIGFVGLSGISWSNGNSWVGIGIGERAYWGRGYGTDAMRVVLRFAFQELNLHRVSLTVFAYNERAVRSYLKAGFHEEGRTRELMLREGVRHDVIEMGILRQEWERTRA